MREAKKVFANAFWVGPARQECGGGGFGDEVMSLLVYRC
jgi:hypothetical protein